MVLRYQNFWTAYGSHLKDSLTLEDGTDVVPLNVSKYQSTLRNIAEEQIPYLHPAESLKSRIYLDNYLFPVYACHYSKTKYQRQ
jgi:hypothetical protein